MFDVSVDGLFLFWRLYDLDDAEFRSGRSHDGSHRLRRSPLSQSLAAEPAT